MNYADEISNRILKFEEFLNTTNLRTVFYLQNTDADFELGWGRIENKIWGLFIKRMKFHYKGNLIMKIENIHQKAIKIRIEAEELEKRILKFESYLSNMRGRCECYCWVKDVDFGLWLHKFGKEWKISFNDQNKTWLLLKNGSLKIKIQAISMFPALLEAIEYAQEDLVTKIQETCIKYDEFEKSLNTRDMFMDPRVGDSFDFQFNEREKLKVTIKRIFTDIDTHYFEAIYSSGTLIVDGSCTAPLSDFKGHFTRDKVSNIILKEEI